MDRLMASAASRRWWLDFADEEALGRVQSVDTATVIVRLDDVEALRALQVNRGWSRSRAAWQATS
ncbi:hypothetical protein IVB30_31910 [Bradyrhizobium sp. 200]|uniref:hypothetical protein n=1 Tax=Bradyrhizobium sp. 200 TaxID=2782665 RepID=UPI002000059E|nr:hypothetical protein [Bradyrhizobium sp. 200]UPJ54663.1 hypothetical protein IVB30_31910 [Bradyrhizobium sp. 200]